jgi:hypothetical protein
MEIFGIPFFDNDFYKMLIKLIINVIFLTGIIRFIYYKYSKKKEYLFTFYLIGTVVFFLCFTLKKYELDLGMALGLFAIFGIIRYRTQPLQTEEMTYLFITIGMAVINALSEEFLSVSELIIINLTVILFIIFGEFILMKFSYNKVHPLAEDINRRIVLQLKYVDGDISKIIADEIKKQEKNLNINVKTYKVFKIDKNLNIITIHVYY